MDSIREYADAHGLLRYNYRCTGRTTRRCDDLIQKLFQNVGEEIQICDHYETRSADEMLARKIIRRLELEHPHVKPNVRISGRRIFMSITDDKRQAMYIVQTTDLFNFRDVFVSSHPQVAFEYMKGLESVHGKRYRIIKRYKK